MPQFVLDFLNKYIAQFVAWAAKHTIGTVLALFVLGGASSVAGYYKATDVKAVIDAPLAAIATPTVEAATTAAQ